MNNKYRSGKQIAAEEWQRSQAKLQAKSQANHLINATNELINSLSEDQLKELQDLLASTTLQQLTLNKITGDPAISQVLLNQTFERFVLEWKQKQPETTNDVD